MENKITYEKSGVNIDVADAAKKEMGKVVSQGSDRVLNRVGAFASVFDIHFPKMKHPVLIMKTEEPGSKQKLSIKHGKIEEICRDMINHLTNDILVMGATPLAVQDAIICGKFQPEIVTRLVKGIAEACKENGSVLTGGETSEQPNVVEAGTYILTSSIIGVCEKDGVIDGSKIAAGDTVIALASNGIHTNGYSFLRMMMASDPSLENTLIDGEKFIDVILKPHMSYYKALTGLFGNPALRGLAHITGGGLQGNLNRILPEGLDAEIDLSQIRVLPIFKFIKKKTDADDMELLKTFNMGVGMTAVIKKGGEKDFLPHFKNQGYDAYPIGKIVKDGNKSVKFINNLKYYPTLCAMRYALCVD
jgi:phosphoribosylformylglycinamidine cyclo-ligase